MGEERRDKGPPRRFTFESESEDEGSRAEKVTGRQTQSGQLQSGQLQTPPPQNGSIQRHHRRLCSGSDSESEEDDGSRVEQSSKVKRHQAQSHSGQLPNPSVSQLPSPPPRIEQNGNIHVQRRPLEQSPHQQNRRQHEVRDARLFTVLEKVMDSTKENNRPLKLLVNRGRLEEQATSSLPASVKFPIKTIEESEAFEDIIMIEQSASSVVKYLAEYGGNNVQDTLARTLKCVMGTELARLYNFKGTKGKRKFKSLNLTNIIYRSVRLNPLCRGTTRKDMEMALQKWLGGARDRDAGRKERIRSTHSTGAGGNDQNTEQL